MARSALATLELAAETPVLEKWKDGSIRVAGSRTPFDRFVELARAGESLDEMQEIFPSLSRATLHRLMAYYLDHRAEVDAWFEKLSAEAEELYAWFEERYPTAELRKRLKARLAETRATRPD